MMVSIRVKATKTIIREKEMTGFQGPTWITKWIMRQAKAMGLPAGEYEYRLGESAGWQS